MSDSDAGGFAASEFGASEIAAGDPHPNSGHASASAADAELLPAGMHRWTREWVVGSGPDDFAWGAVALQTGELFRAAGLRPESAGDVWLFHPGVGELRPFRFAVLVSRRVTEERRSGISLATAPGHPLTGEERLDLELLGDDVVLRLDEVSRPTPGGWSAAWPGVRLAQATLQRRYGPAMRQLLARRPRG